VNYSDIISRALRTLKKGGIWGFVASTYGATFAVLIGAVAVAFFASGPAETLRAIGGLGQTSAPSLSTLRPVFFVYGGLIIGSLLTIPIALISYGGLIHLTDGALAGRDVTISEAWAFGARRMGRVIAIELLFGLVATALALVGSVPLIVAIVAAARADSAGPAILVGFCGSGLLILLLVLILELMVGFEALAVRYALIGDRTAGDAIGAGWAAFRARFGSVLLLLLMLFGLGLLIGLVQSAVQAVLEFVSFGTVGLSAAIRGSAWTRHGTGVFVGVYALIYLIVFVVAAFRRVLHASLWTAFFRQMTGLDVPIAPASPAAFPAYPPYSGTTPQPPHAQQPAPQPTEQPTPAPTQPTTQQPAPQPTEPAPPMAGSDV
jgi:hypothetical protein